MDQLLPWYNQELAWLRHASVDFSNRFPNVAGQLGLHGAGCEDPHVERLIESFAFLTARISRQLDQESAQLAGTSTCDFHPSMSVGAEWGNAE